MRLRRVSPHRPAKAFPLVAHLAQPTPAPGGTAQGESSFLDQYGSQILVAEDRRFGWDRLFSGSQSRVVVLGQPGAGKLVPRGAAPSEP